MSILAQLLPGIRDLRAPLACGALWLLCGWLAWPLLPPAVHSAGQVQRMEELQHLAGTSALVAALPLGAYLTGIVLRDIGYIAVYAIICFFVVFPMGLTLALSIGATILLIGGPLALPGLLVHALLPRSWRQPGRTWLYIRYLWTIISRVLVYPPLEILRSALFASANSRRDFVSNVLEERITQDPNFLSGLLEDCTPKVLKRMLLEILAERPDALRLTGKLRVEDQVVDLFDAACRCSEHPESASLLRKTIDDKLQSSRELRELVLIPRTQARTKPVLERVLRNAEAYFRCEKELVFQQYDQLRSEAEFRRAIAAPAVATLWLYFFPVMPAEYNFSKWLILGASSIPGAILLATASQREDEAQHILLSSLHLGDLAENGGISAHPIGFSIATPGADEWILRPGLLTYLQRGFLYIQPSHRRKTKEHSL